MRVIGIGSIELLFLLMTSALLVYFAVRGRVGLPGLALLVVLLSPLVAIILAFVLLTVLATFASA